MQFCLWLLQEIKLVSTSVTCFYSWYLTRKEKNDTLPPPRMPFSHEVIKTSNFSLLPVLSIWISYYFNFLHIDIILLIIMIGWLARPKLWWRNNVCGAPGYRWINRTATNNIICTGALGVSRSSEVRAVGYFSHIWPWEIPRSIGVSGLVADQTICGNFKMPWSDERLEIWRMGWESTNVTGNWNGSTEPTGPVPEPFHCDHIARWSARSGTTGRSGTGVNTGARSRSGTVPVPKLWFEHGLS